MKWEKDKSGQKTLVRENIFRAFMVIILLTTSVLAVCNFLAIRNLQKPLRDFGKQSENIQLTEETPPPEGAPPVPPETDEKKYFLYMDNQYNHFINTITDILTLAGIIVTIFVVVPPLFNLVYAQNALDRGKKLLDEAAINIFTMEESFWEKMDILNYYNAPVPYAPMPDPKTEEGKAYLYFMKGYKEYEIARYPNTPHDTRNAHFISAIKALEEAIEIKPEAKMYQLKARCNIELADCENPESNANRGKYLDNAEKDVDKGLKQWPDDPSLLFTQATICATLLQLNSPDVKKSTGIKTPTIDDINVAIDNIESVIKKGNPIAYHYYIKAALFYELSKYIIDGRIEKLKDAKKIIANVKEDSIKDDPYISDELDDLGRKIQGELNNDPV